MSLPFSNYSQDDWRLIGLLGGFAFAMLAGLTALGIAADSMFVSIVGAQKMAFGIIAGQALVIPVFRIYGWLRNRLRARYVTPLVVAVVLLTLLVLFFSLQHRPTAAAIAVFVLLPCISGLMAGESGRLSASLLNPRLARRLFPSIGSIGGFGASFGAFISGWVVANFGSAWLLPLAGGFFLLTLVPASRVGTKLRPRIQRPGKAILRRHRYAVSLVVAAGLIAALTTILRYQVGAAASEVYDAERLSLFYSRLSLIINLIAVAFTLFLTRATVNGLGAANSLLIYPVLVLSVIGALIAIPTLGLVAAAVATERLVRQNIHRTVNSLAIMPLDIAMRTRVALVNNGSARPLGTILASVAVLFLTGELGVHWITLSWQQFTYGVLVLVSIILGCLVYVRGRYVRELVNSLHSRRLQLDASDSAATLEPDVREQIMSYLASELPERNLLAIRLLHGHTDRDVVAALEEHWTSWDTSTREEAINLLASGDDEAAAAFLSQIAKDKNDPANAAARAAIVKQLEPDELRQAAQHLSGKSRALVIAELLRRDQDADALVEARRAATSPDAADQSLAADIIAALESPLLDEFRAELLHKHPAAILPTLARRPDATLCAAIVPFMNRDETVELARDALAASGSAALDALATGLLRPEQAWHCANLIVALGGPEGDRHILAALQQTDQRIVLVTLGALARSRSAPTAELKEAIDATLQRALADAAYFHHKDYPDSPALTVLAKHHAMFALEIVFAALDASYPDMPFRQLFLASQSGDTRQQSLAAEALDEALPAALRKRVLELLETSAAPSTPPGANPAWESIAEKLQQPENTHTRMLDGLLRSGLFPGWCYAELAELTTPDGDDKTAHLTIRDGAVVGLEEVLLTGKSATSQSADVLVSLRQVYRTIARNPRCGGLWLRGLASRVSDPKGSHEAVTRSEQLSLATRSLAEDEQVAGSIDLWQRVFFLRTMSLTQTLPPARLRLIAEISRTVRAEPGELVVTRGRLGNHFYMVCTGALEVLDGDKVIARLGPSDAFGAMSLMRGARRSFSVRVSASSELLTIDRTDFLDLIDGHPSLVRSFSRSLALRIRAARVSTGDATLIK